MRRPLLFYSAWPLGYHNLEAERKAIALANAGYDVAYVAGVGIRNPRPYNVTKVLDRVRRVASSRYASGDTVLPKGLHAGAVMVLPPRQLSAMRRLNTAWMTRQLRSQIEHWEHALAWVRWPTPELVQALARLRPAHTIYEVVDAYEATPGITGRWLQIYDRHEALMLEQADLVVVSGERLAERYRARHAHVRVLPHGVDLIPWHGIAARDHSAVVVGFAGTLDARLDVAVLRAVAERHPEWQLRLIGPVQDGFDRRPLADLANVSIEPPVAAADVPALVASFDLGLMPYLDHANTTHMTPLKNLEYMAAGVPAVGRRLPALEPFADLVYFADSPAEFVDQLERALSEQSPDRAQARRAVAERNGWPRRLAEVVAIANEISGGPAC